MSRLEEWEAKLTNITQDFNAFYAKIQGDEKTDENKLFRLYCFRKKVRAALEEGRVSLVVSPRKDVVDSYSSLLRVIQDYLDKYSTIELNKQFAKRLFEQNTSLFSDRFALLDSLLYRRAAANQWRVEPPEFTPSIEPEKTFRDTCRSNLENVFSKAMDVLYLRTCDSLDPEDLCVLKASEIESEMFERFQDELGLGSVSEDYRNTARSLKSNLGNADNLSLCLRVLTGDIAASALVKMSPDQLASEKAKLDRENAKNAALKDTVLTPAVLNVQPSTSNPVHHKPPSHDKKPLSSILKGTRPVEHDELSHLSTAKDKPLLDPADVAKTDTSTKDATLETEAADGAPTLEDDADGAPTLDDDDSADGAPTLDHDETVNSANDSATSVKPQAISCLKRSFVSTTLRPPPPPSLAVGAAFLSSQHSDSEDSQEASKGEKTRRVCGAFGGDKFSVEIQGTSKLVLNVAFYQENNLEINISPFMPESLIQKGRSRIDEFKRFLIEKLKGGRWKATSLRLATISEKDLPIYKSFYKEYESIERIAMFKLNGDSGSKLFLVTPKFHGKVERTGMVTFSSATCTYAIVLTRTEET